jgi:hypothetical protein
MPPFRVFSVLALKLHYRRADLPWELRTMSSLVMPQEPVSLAAAYAPPQATLVEADPLARLASHAGVDALYDEGQLSEAARDAAHEAILGPRDWLPWIDRSLLALGVSLVVAGIVFFFAYNWSIVPGWGKLALSQGLVWGFAVAAWNCNIERLLGQTLLTAAAMMVGVMIAVFGQVYQTGADAWTGFALWAALILPWVLVGRFQPLWLLWAVLLNVAAITWWLQTIDQPAWWGQAARPEWRSPAWLFSGLIALNAGLFALGEWGAGQGWEFLAPRWPRWIVALWLAGVATFPVLLSIVKLFEPSAPIRGMETPGGQVNVLLWLALLVGGFLYARYRTRDVALLTFVHLSALAAALTFVFCVVFLTHQAHHGPFLGTLFLFYGICVFAGFGGLAFLLRHFGREMAAEEEVVLPVAKVVEPGGDDALAADLSSAMVPELAAVAAIPAEQPPVTWYRVLAIVAGAGKTPEPFVQAATERALFEARGGEDPWYYHLLVGAGAWIAALFIFPWLGLFLAPLGPHGAPYGAMLFGLAFIAAGILLRKHATGTFSQQFALVTSVVGHGNVLGGLAFALGLEHDRGDMEVFTVVSLALLAATYVLYDDFLHRCLAALAALSIVTSWVMLRFHWTFGPNELALQILAALEAAAFVAFALVRWHPPLARPAWYALAVHLAGLVVLLAFVPHFGPPRDSFDWVPVWSLAAALGGLCVGLIARQGPKNWPEPAALAALACVLLAVAGSPQLQGASQHHIWQVLSSASIAGLILAVLFIVAGKSRGDVFVRAIGVVLLPVLVILYYYSLEFSLFAKACVLAASGAVLLAARSAVLVRAKAWETAS